MSVPPADLATQPVGEAAEVAEGVYQIKLPLPLPLRFVSVYLVEGPEGWTLVDAGFDYPPAREAWEKGAASVGCRLGGDVARILVTHFHPDHLGGARWLQERTGAPVYMLGEEISRSRTLWEEDRSQALACHLRRHGMPPEVMEDVSGMRMELRLPEEMAPLCAGEEVPLGGGRARAIHAPGHADHQMVLHDEERRILYAADHLLLGITPSVGLWPESDPHPLESYLGSLASLRGLRANLVLPGHGPVFYDLDGRISELIEHHTERLDATLATLSGRPLTPYEISLRLFRRDLTVYERCFALAETLAHLDKLVLERRAERIEDETVLFRPWCLG